MGFSTTRCLHKGCENVVVKSASAEQIPTVLRADSMLNDIQNSYNVPHHISALSFHLSFHSDLESLFWQTAGSKAAARICSVV